MAETQSSLLLKRQLAELKKKPVDGFSAGLVDDENIYKWDILVIGPPETLFEGGFFKALLEFPREYPLRPPKMRFTSEIWHPNVDKDGNVCVSILHEPGDDRFGYEKPEERWLPVHTVETILISVISVLADPNDESPANVDAALAGGILGAASIRGSEVEEYWGSEGFQRMDMREDVRRGERREDYTIPPLRRQEVAQNVIEKTKSSKNSDLS